ncbi:flavodoxin domain-containing protein [uncultured Treponema sp.]|uniref:FprA family A-type flavoprotein n=1 Tax=uncultured Treponema sp. TaxID=162155 RepID=UPI002600A05F|nr:flavodoxin domain-containing protein [uncultured Treponema sp.]
MKITDSIKYIGVDDHEIDLFEGQFDVPNGMAYNSYIIIDEKIAVMDSVDAHFGEQWLSNLKNELSDRKPDYLVVQHMEMDHSANIKKFAESYPEAKIVSSKMAFVMMKSYFGTDFADRQLVVAEGSKLELGKHTLNFIAAPNVHWPEVIFTYESSEKVLFSADAFGKFGANDYDDPEGWACEARRYYFGIVGKFGANVQAVLKKAAALEINTLAPLHGPVLSGDDAKESLRLYDIWSSYGVETEGVCVLYTSVYGNTKQAAEKFAEILKVKGCPKVAISDLAREDTYECVEDAFRYGKLVLATTTYNGSVFPIMREFIEHLTERGYQNRKIGFIENGSWAPMAAKNMATMFESCKNLTFCESKATIKIAMNEETNAQLEKLAEEILK